MWFGNIAWMVFWLFVAAVVLLPQYLRYRERGRMHETMRIALDKGQPLPPDMMEALRTSERMDVPMSTPERDLRRAVVLIGVGAGLALLGYGLWYGLSAIPGDGGDIASYIVGGCVAGAGAIPGLIGVAYLILWAMKRQPVKAA